MINYILLLLIFISCFLIISRINLKIQYDKYKNKSNSLFQTKEIQFKNFISKINFIKTKEIFLSKQGYPLKLDVIRYYLLKINMFLLSIYYICRNTSILRLFFSWFIYYV